METKPPTDIKLHRKSATLELAWADGSSHQLSAEFLRVHSPSAEVRGHGKGQEILQFGKRQVKLVHVEAVGNYAVKLSFDDGHESGIYSWTYLHELCVDRDTLWNNYLVKLHVAGASRDQLPADTQVINIMPAPPK
ncbi:MAG: DUF971 domain-containing protein [Proteobacteria bacterium]|nr:DUF971 domain-containing protein [Pseudomonadota bacterium]